VLQILLTGGDGFIGRNLKEAWRNRYSVVYPKSSELDLLDGGAVEQFVASHRFDVVIHAATWNATTTSTKDLSRVFENNCRIFFNLERAKNSYGRLISFGSGAEYDRASMEPLTPEDRFSCHIPTDSYGFSKYVIARMIERSSSACNLRLFAVFGAHEDWRIRFISNACCRALFNLPITIRQNRRFDYMHVGDLAMIVGWFIEHTPHHASYNVCTSRPIDLLTLAEIVLEVSAKHLPIQVAEEGSGLEYSGDNSRLLAEMGCFSFADVKSRIEELYNWYEARKDSIDPSLL